MLRAPVFHCLTRSCVEECQRTGSLKETSIKHCMVPADGQPADKSWYAHEPLYLQWKEWNCKTECRYHCMMERENERKELNLLLPVKYHGKWPLKRASVFQVISRLFAQLAVISHSLSYTASMPSFQEPLSAALSALTLIVQFNGWLSFFLLLYYKLPVRPGTHKTYYEYTGLWHIYGLLAMNSWFWSAIYHSW
jgi:post-GPI attachment to proteins factor 3